MYLSPWKFFQNQILLDYLGRWRNQSCQIFFQSVYSGVSGKGSNFAIFSANRRWPLQHCCTTVELWLLWLLSLILWSDYEFDDRVHLDDQVDHDDRVYFDDRFDFFDREYLNNWEDREQSELSTGRMDPRFGSGHEIAGL